MSCPARNGCRAETPIRARAGLELTSTTEAAASTARRRFSAAVVHELHVLKLRFALDADRVGMDSLHRQRSKSTLYIEFPKPVVLENPLQSVPVGIREISLVDFPLSISPMTQDCLFRMKTVVVNTGIQYCSLDIVPGLTSESTRRSGASSLRFPRLTAAVNRRSQ